MSEVDDVAQAADRAAPAAAGPDAVIDAVGMEAHGSPRAARSPRPPSACCRTRWRSRSIDQLAVDRLDALHTALKAVRRGGTVSLSGVYGGEIDPMPMMEMFDRGIQLRMGQCHVKRWIDDIMPLVARRRRPARHPRPAPPTCCRWRRRRTATRSSRRRRTAA